MKINYAQIESRCSEPPVLRLQTMAGKELGPIPFASGINFDMNWSELSSLEFDVPYMADGIVNPVYKLLKGFHRIYTEHHGVYVVDSPTISGDGVKETVHCTAYSLEKTLDWKQLYIPEGVYDFYNPFSDHDTIISIILESAPGWRVGDIDTALWGMRRTFDEYNDTVLGFCYGAMMEKYQCAVVFDVYNMTINAYGNNTELNTLPIYLDYDNLVENTKITEVDDDLVTKLHPYGADGLNIRSVNPTGEDYIIDLSYFVAAGDLDVNQRDGTLLSDRYAKWQHDIASHREYYTGLVSSRCLRSSLLLTERFNLAELQSEKELLQQEESVLIREVNLEKPGTEEYKNKLAEREAKTQEIVEKTQEIADKEGEIAAIEAEIDGINGKILSVQQKLRLNTYAGFDDSDRNVLACYLIEGDMTDETFVATDVDTTLDCVGTAFYGSVTFDGRTADDGTFYPYTYQNMNIAPPVSDDTTSTEVDTSGRTMHSFKEGVLTITFIDGSEFSADFEQITLETYTDNKYLFSAQVKNVQFGEKQFSQGTLTVTGVSGNGLEFEDVAISAAINVPDGDDKETSNMYFVASVNDYQQFTVETELLEYAADVLSKAALPVMEFSITSANYLFLEEFASFKNETALGQKIHLSLGSEGHLSPALIGIKFGYGNPESLTLTFSNRYQRRDNVKTFSDMIRKASSAGRSFDASKHAYNRTSDQGTRVSEFMNSALDAAKNKVTASTGNEFTVDISGAGITVGSPSSQIRIVDDMICMIDDTYGPKIAIGRYQGDSGKYFAVNADVLAGKILIGNQLLLENERADGEIAKFSFDKDGAWLFNSNLVLQSDDGNGSVLGQIVMASDYGIAAGKNICTVDDTGILSTTFMDSSGELKTDDDGMPTGASFYLGMDGSAYFRGTVYATAGDIGGWILDGERLCSGENNTYVALDAGSKDSNDKTIDYAFWAGGNTPETAKFRLKRSGEININDQFKVDPDGTVTMSGDIHLTGNIDFGNNDVGSGSVYDLATGNYVPDIPDDSTATTFISRNNIYSPNITGGTVTGCNFYATGYGRYNGAAYYIKNGNGSVVGYLSYDELAESAMMNGSTVSYKKRVFLKAMGAGTSMDEGTALKMESDYGISIEAPFVYIAGGSTSNNNSAIIVTSSGIELRGNVTLPSGTTATAVFG